MRIRLVQARKDKHLTQQDVADAIGIHRSVYGRYEQGLVQIPSDRLILLVAFLQMRMEDAIFNDPTAPRRTRRAATRHAVPEAS